MAKKNQGTAIITALFIVTLIAIIATAMSSRLQMDIHRTELIKSSDKHRLASQSVVFWAMDRLADEHQPLKAQDDAGKVLVFPNKMASIYPGIKTQGAIYDMQARFNLNNVTDESFLPVYFGLLQSVFKDSDSKSAIQIIDATVHWIKGPSKTQAGHDDWFDRYTKQRPVYFPPYQLMQDPSELRTVIGVTPQIYQALQPYITALPNVTAINLNTAPLLVLRALGDGLTEHDAHEIELLRQTKELKQTSDLGEMWEKLHIPVSQITFSSDYFLVVTKTSSYKKNQTYYALLKREKNKGKINVTRLHQCAATFIKTD